MTSPVLNFIFMILLFFASKEANSIDLHIHGAKSDTGFVRILLFDSEKGYPDNPAQAVKSFSIKVKNRKSFIRIDDLKPGKYAISVIHDEDENGELNTNPFGFPTEKYGFSNNAKAYFSNPPFSKASFELRDERKIVLINLR